MRRSSILNGSIKFVLTALLVFSCPWIVEAGFVYDDHGKRDPLWPLVTPGGAIRYFDAKISVEDMRLEGVMLGDENLAIINGKVVKVNDNIGGFVVKMIDANAVTIEKEGKEYDLKLKKGE